MTTGEQEHENRSGAGRTQSRQADCVDQAAEGTGTPGGQQYQIAPGCSHRHGGASLSIRAEVCPEGGVIGDPPLQVLLDIAGDVGQLDQLGNLQSIASMIPGDGAEQSLHHEERREADDSMAVVEDLSFIIEDSLLALEDGRELDHAGGHLPCETADPGPGGGVESHEHVVDQSMPLDEKEMGLVAEIGSCRTRGGGSCTRSFTVETVGEEGKGLPGLRRVVGEVFIRVEHPGVEIADSCGPGIVLGEEEDAGGEGAGGMGEDGPDEVLGILDRSEVVQAGIVPVDQSALG